MGNRVIFHGLKVFNFMPFLGQDWEEQKIKEFMTRARGSKKGANK
jgi:hypothetical protein